MISGPSGCSCRDAPEPIPADDHPPAANQLRSRILLRKLRADAAHLIARLFERNTRLQPPDSQQIMGSTISTAPRRKSQRQEDIGGQSEKDLEPGRQHSHNLKCPPIELQRTAERASIQAQPPLPKRMGHHDHVHRAIHLLRCESAAQLRRDAIRFKEVGGGHDRRKPSWLAGSREVELAQVIRIQRRAAMEQVLSEMERRYGTWRVPWGDINRLQRNQSGGDEPFSDERPSLPIAGAPGDAGIIFDFYARPQPGQKRRYGTAGHSFVSVIDFGPQVQARSILVFGENFDLKSPHYFDQSELYARQQFKLAWFTLADIKAHTERTYYPGG